MKVIPKAETAGAIASEIIISRFKGREPNQTWKLGLFSAGESKTLTMPFIKLTEGN